MTIEIIKKCFQTDRVLYSRHATFEMDSEEFGKIIDAEVEESIKNGEIIAEYFDDTPYPSVLVYGETLKKRPLHIVCAYNKNDDMVIIITVYHPNPALWIDGRNRRK
jgi:hypothetical protein